MFILYLVQSVNGQHEWHIGSSDNISPIWYRMRFRRNDNRSFD